MMALFHRLRRSVALFICPDLSERVVDRNASAVPKLTVENPGNADFDATFDKGLGQYRVTIKPRTRCDGIEFPDGSIGIEWGPEDGSCIQRRVECPRGGLSAQLTANDDDWSGCDAAAWAATPSRVDQWTVVYQPITNFAGASAVAVDGLAKDHWPVPGIERGFSHE